MKPMNTEFLIRALLVFVVIICVVILAQMPAFFRAANSAVPSDYAAAARYVRVGDFWRYSNATDGGISTCVEYRHVIRFEKGYVVYETNTDTKVPRRERYLPERYFIEGSACMDANYSRKKAREKFNPPPVEDQTWNSW